MRHKSVKTKLLFTIAVMVVSSGMVISGTIMHQYWINLSQSAEAQAHGIAHNLSLDAADKILINDLVAVQKLFDYQMKSDPSVNYLFVVLGGSVLTHTFSGGIPTQLVEANVPLSNNKPHFQKIASETGERFVDVAWPIFDGNSGYLRLGYSQSHYREQMVGMWIRICLLTIGVLGCALVVGFFTIRQITEPLMRLTGTVENIDENHLGIELPIEGGDEVGRLAVAFQGMLKRVDSYTRRLKDSTKALEEKHQELDRAHRQTRSLFETAKRASALADLTGMCNFLINQLQQIITCRQMVVLICTENPPILLAFTRNKLERMGGASAEKASALLAGMEKMAFSNKSELPLALPEFAEAKRIAVFPLRDAGRLIGAMCVGCPGDCDCVANDLSVIEMILAQIAGAVGRAAGQENQIRNLKNRIERAAGFGDLIGKDSQMQIIYKLIEDIAPTDATVLITGESGTGKELVARAIHQKSPRKEKAFVVINCSAYPATLLESELFGHEKGAFTGAVRQKAGRFEQADGGTVFLDEIGDISPTAQVKLLRVLQTKKFERIGGNTTLSVNIRIVAATNKNLLQAAQDGEFREDLFYRLHVIPIHLPALRDRRNDIPLLAGHFLERFNAIQNKGIKEFSSEAMRELLDYAWPGNVRELENSIEHAVILARDETIRASDFPATILNASEMIKTNESPPPTLGQSEKAYLEEALRACDWNKKAAARKLGIGRSTLYAKLKKHRITLEND